MNIEDFGKDREVMISLEDDGKHYRVDIGIPQGKVSYRFCKARQGVFETPTEVTFNLYYEYQYGEFIEGEGNDP